MKIHPKVQLTTIGIVLLFLNACGVFKTYKPVVTNGVVSLPLSSYSFNQQMTAADAQLIDTTALYYQVFDMAKSNADEQTRPMIIKFESNGFYREGSPKDFRKYEQQPKNYEALDYGGKFYLDGNKIFIQDFYLNGQGSYIHRYTREVSKGSIRNDTLRITFFNHEQVYVKRAYSEVFK